MILRDPTVYLIFRRIKKVIMAELIRTAKDGSIGFGDFKLTEKSKLSDFEFMGDVYKVKTFRELTKLEKNDMFLYESEPGTSVEGLKLENNVVSFTVEGDGNTQITLGLEDDTEYRVTVGSTDLGKMATNMGGKLIIAVDLTPGKPERVAIERI
ncbi:MAG: endosialidase [Lachnospiraceae bacterium]|nr:endosialidase [Lachnospiraceae bacterium]